MTSRSSSVRQGAGGGSIGDTGAGGINGVGYSGVDGVGYSGSGGSGVGGSQGQTDYGLKRRELLRQRYRPTFWLLAVHVLLVVLVIGDFANLNFAIESALRSSELLALAIAVSVTTLVILLPFLAGKFSRHWRHQRRQRQYRRQQEQWRHLQQEQLAGSTPTVGGVDTGSRVEADGGTGADGTADSGGSAEASYGTITSNSIQSNIIIIVLLAAAWVAVLVALTLLRLSLCGIGPFVGAAADAGAVGAGSASAAAGSGSAIAAIGASARSQPLAAELAMVVVLTVMLAGSGIVAFASAWAKDPQRQELKGLEYQQLALQESVEQLSALQCEYQQADGYYLSIIEGDQACYFARQRQLDAESDVIRHQARLRIAEALGSPASTSALTYMVEDRRSVQTAERRSTRTEDGRSTRTEDRRAARTEDGRTAHRPQIQGLDGAHWDNEQASGQ